MLIKQDQFDVLLESNNFRRIHVARDASSLYRCLADLIYGSQIHYPRVQAELIQFLQLNPQLYPSASDEVTVHEYANRIIDPLRPATFFEIQLAAVRYRKLIILFDSTKDDLDEPIKFDGRDEISSEESGLGDEAGWTQERAIGATIIRIAWSSIDQYDIIITEEVYKKKALAQALVYENLVKFFYGFSSEKIKAIQESMLKEKKYALLKKERVRLKRYFTQVEGNTDGLDLRDVLQKEYIEPPAGASSILETPPYPYKMAKALDPETYRNVAFDLWEQKNGDRLRNMLKIEKAESGTQCLIRIYSAGNQDPHSSPDQLERSDQGFDDSGATNSPQREPKHDSDSAQVRSHKGYIKFVDKFNRVAKVYDAIDHKLMAVRCEDIDILSMTLPRHERHQRRAVQTGHDDRRQQGGGHYRDQGSIIRQLTSNPTNNPPAMDRVANFIDWVTQFGFGLPPLAQDYHFLGSPSSSTSMHTMSSVSTPQTPSYHGQISPIFDPLINMFQVPEFLPQGFFQ